MQALMKLATVAYNGRETCTNLKFKRLQIQAQNSNKSNKSNQCQTGYYHYREHSL